MHFLIPKHLFQMLFDITTLTKAYFLSVSTPGFDE